MTDKSNDKIMPEECQHTTYHHPKWHDDGTCNWDDLKLQPKSFNAQAKCVMPPTKVIPVIFLPGVMGSNLKALGGEFIDDEPIWRGDSDIQVYLDWAKLKGPERKKLLNPDTTVVDDRGEISTKIYSRITDDGQGEYGALLPTRKARGWGEVLHFSYGNTLSVLQAALLDDWQKAVKRCADGQRGLSENPKENGIVRQLCNKFLGTEDKKEEMLTDAEVSHFLQFLYPLHVFGYNWLEDNAVSAEKLVNYIDKILQDYQSDEKHGHGLAVNKVILVTHSMGG